jgi:DNA ligase-1
MKSWPKLYKVDNKGKVRVWWIIADDWQLEGPPCYYQYHGVLDGKIQNTYTNVPEGKNIGKANETTAYEQCCLEAESLWTKQRDRKGYSETMPTEKPFGPMLAKSYDKDGHHIKFPCYVQPKLDGLRCIGTAVNRKITLTSRQNKVFKVLQHVEKELARLPFNTKWDGELYIHHESFQNIVGAIKRDESNELTSKIQYYIYDFVDDRLPFKDRLARLNLAMDTYIDTLNCAGEIHEDGSNLKYLTLQKVPTSICECAEDLVSWHKVYVDAGYEGIMLRNMDGLYKIGGRSQDLQKYKVFMDQEFKIIGAEENKGKLAGTCVFVCTTDDEGIFKVMPEGSEEQRRQYWEDWNSGKIKIGDEITVKFFSWSTSTPKVPRFPIGKGIRNYE